MCQQAPRQRPRDRLIQPPQLLFAAPAPRAAHRPRNADASDHLPEASAQSQLAVAGQHRAGLAHDNVPAGQIECGPHMLHRAATKRRGFRREVDPDRASRSRRSWCRRASALAARRRGRAGLRSVLMSSRWFGTTRRATAPRAGEPPISSATSLTAATPLPTVSRPSARNGTGGAGRQHSEVGPAAGNSPSERSVVRQLAGEAGPQSAGPALPVKRHVQPRRAIGPRSGEPRSEMPVLAAELHCAGGGQRAGVQCRQRRVDAGEGQPSDREPAILDPRRERREPGRRPLSQHARSRRPRDMQIGPAQHQLARIDMPADQRQSAIAQPQRLARGSQRSAGRLPPTLTCAAVSIGCGSSVSEIGPLW